MDKEEAQLQSFECNTNLLKHDFCDLGLNPSS